MLKNLATLAATVAAFYAASFSHAAIVPVITPLVPPGSFVGPWAGLNGGDWAAYQVDIMTDDGSLIRAVDVSITGIFHQTWSDPEFDGFLNPSPRVPANALTGDSGLTPLAGALIGSAPTEDNNGQNGAGGSPLTDTFVPGAFTGGFDHGVGSFLEGAWGIPGADQTTSASLARLVIPVGSEPCVEFSVSISTTNGTATFRPVFPLDHSCVPEQTSVVLAAIGMIGFMGRRQ